MVKRRRRTSVKNMTGRPAEAFKAYLARAEAVDIERHLDGLAEVRLELEGLGYVVQRGKRFDSGGGGERAIVLLFIHDRIQEFERRKQALNARLNKKD